VFWGVRGHPRSLETSPFDRAHMTSYSTFNRNYTSILYRFRVIARFSSKMTNFNPPHLHLIPFEFCHDFWHQKTRVMVLSCGVVCAIRRLAVLYNTGVWQTDRHTTTANTTLSIASRGKNWSGSTRSSLYCCHSLVFRHVDWLGDDTATKKDLYFHNVFII